MIDISSTPECEAWCRGFSYSDYLRVCDVMGTKGVLSEVGYKGACELLDVIFERHVGFYQEEHYDLKN